MFEWDDANEAHIARHGVSPEEVEEALLDRRRIGVPAYAVERETRWAAIGSTEQGRILCVVFTRRAERVRVITARDATSAETRRYSGGDDVTS